MTPTGSFGVKSYGAPRWLRLNPSGVAPRLWLWRTGGWGGSRSGGLIANALVHRDLDNWSAGLAVEVRLRRDRLVISNPGGLYGITVERLGHDAVTSARNARLVALCQHVRTPETGARVIEALASGIPTIRTALIATPAST